MAPLGERRKQSDNVEASFGVQLHAGPQKNTHIIFNGSKLYAFFGDNKLHRDLPNI